ncbi:hypothetical protein ACJX0J_030635, partial [Zea mays]
TSTLFLLMIIGRLKRNACTLIDMKCVWFTVLMTKTTLNPVLYIHIKTLYMLKCDFLTFCRLVSVFFLICHFLFF